MVRLTTGDVCEISKMPRETLNLWVKRGSVPGIKPKGPGNHRHYTIVQLTAVAYAYMFLKLGYSSELCQKIVRFLCSYSEKELLREFRAGRTHLIPCADLSMKLTYISDENSPLNVEKLYYEVLYKIDQVQKELQQRDNGTRRKRGLAQ